MNSSSYDQIEKYINATGIDEKTRMLVSDFAILWNRYENELYKTSHSTGKIKDTIENNNLINRSQETINSCFDDLIAYIKQRYNRSISAELVANRFSINLRDNNDGHGDIWLRQLERIIRGYNSFDRLYFLLLICARVRNNMFHGIKVLKELNLQKRLFEICCRILISVLDDDAFRSLQ